MIKPFAAVLFVLCLTQPTAQAQGGCVNSPEHATLTLALIAVSAFAVFFVRRTHPKRGK